MALSPLLVASTRQEEEGEEEEEGGKFPIHGPIWVPLSGLLHLIRSA